MNSKQVQAKSKSRVPLLRHVCRRWPAVNLGCKQSFVEGRDATGMVPDRIAGDKLTFPSHPRWQCYGSTPFSRWILAQQYSAFYS